MAREDAFTATIGEIKVCIDYGTTTFHLEMPDPVSPRELVRALRLVADLGFQVVDFREYDPVPDAHGVIRIELERTACR